MQVETKRDKILAAALQLIRQLGYRKVTMSDVADAAGISRPTLYAEFANKEAIMAAILEQHAQAHELATAQRLAKLTSLKARLHLVFAIWIVAPFAEVADDPNARDLVENIGTYIPDAVREFYARFERQLLAVLEAEMRGKRTVTAQTLAHVLALAAKGLKTSSTSTRELVALIDGLVAMALATIAT